MESTEIFISERELNTARKQISEYAMAFDLLAQITHSCTEQETIESILRVFETLFSPQTVFYMSLESGRPGQVYSSLSLKEDPQTIRNRLANFDKKYAWTVSGDGFRVLISYGGKGLGVIEIDALKFPADRDRYLNLTLSLVNVCGLAIENARRWQQIRDAESKLRNEKEKLEEALANVKKLSGLIPICGHCKKIRDDKGYWNQIEGYIQERSEAKFSHGICQECMKKYYPEYDVAED